MIYWVLEPEPLFFQSHFYASQFFVGQRHGVTITRNLTNYSGIDLASRHAGKAKRVGGSGQTLQAPCFPCRALESSSAGRQPCLTPGGDIAPGAPNPWRKGSHLRTGWLSAPPGPQEKNTDSRECENAAQVDPSFVGNSAPVVIPQGKTQPIVKHSWGRSPLYHLPDTARVVSILMQAPGARG